MLIKYFILLAKFNPLYLTCKVDYFKLKKKNAHTHDMIPLQTLNRSRPGGTTTLNVTANGVFKESHPADFFLGLEQ